MRAPTNILRTKLHPPKTVNDHVHRVRLVEKLNNNFQKNALTLVSAPAGYGKSYLVSCWLTESKIPYGWISLSEDDNDPRTFLEYLLAAVEKVSPGKLEKTYGLLQAAELPPLSVITNLLINELDEIEKEFVLVLDDYHLIKEKKVHDLIDGLLQYPPDNMLLCIIARRDPPLKIGSFRAYNRMNEIRMEDLSFTVQEIPILYKNMIGLGINEEISEKLLKRTEGWVTGLRLTAHSVKTIEQLESMLNKTKGYNRFLTEYLVEEVLLRNPEEYQNLLIQTSILDRFCVDVVDYVNITGTDKKNKGTSGEAFIEWLESTNLFVIPLDNENKWFRYHHEFKRLLQKQVKEKRSPEQIKTIHTKASEWFEKNNLIDEALYHALAAEDVEQAVRLIEQNRKSAVNSDQWYLLDKWLEILPDKIVQQHPELLMARGWVLLHHLQFEAVFQLMDHIESLIGDDTTKESLRGEIALFRGYILYFLGNGAGSIKYIEEALKKIPLSYHEARAQSEVIFALSNQMEGRKEKAFGGLDKLLSNYTSSNEVRKTRLLITYVFIHIISCDLDQAKLSNQRLREVAENGHAYATAWTNHLEGLIHLIRYELDEAIKFLGKSVSQRYILFQRAAVDSISALMFAYQMKGRSNDANKILQMLREFTASLNDPYYLALADSAEARLAIMQGQSETAISWQDSNALPAMEPAMIWWFEVLSVTHCRALITDGSSTNLEEAQKLLQKFVEINETHHNTFQIIVIILLQVIAYKEQNKIEEALTVLEKAVSLAEPGSIVFPFLELGQPMAELLKQLLPDDINKEFIQTLLNNFEKVKTGNKIVHIPASNDGQDRITEHLTDREIEILTLLSRGLKNREIGDKIFLAQTTIKKHIYNIYQKLDVHSRIEVVNRAKELNIIS